MRPDTAVDDSSSSDAEGAAQVQQPQSEYISLGYSPLDDLIEETAPTFTTYGVDSASPCSSQQDGSYSSEEEGPEVDIDYGALTSHMLARLEAEESAVQASEKVVQDIEVSMETPHLAAGAVAASDSEDEVEEITQEFVPMWPRLPSPPLENAKVQRIKAAMGELKLDESKVPAWVDTFDWEKLDVETLLSELRKDSQGH